MLQGYRMHFHMKDIVKHWKMSTAKLYTLIKDLELPALPKENVVAKRKESRQKNRKTGKQTKPKQREVLPPIEQISLLIQILKWCTVYQRLYRYKDIARPYQVYTVQKN